MAVQVPPTRVPGGRVPVRVATGAFVACLVLVVTLGIFGQDWLSPMIATPAPASADAMVSPQPSSTPPTDTATPVPSEPIASPRSGVAAVSSGAATMLVEPASLVPSGVDVLSHDPGAYYRLALDPSGALWGLGGGTLARIDLARGTGRVWTLQDDNRFVPGDLVLAAAGGVWLSQGQSVRRFDGSGFREAYDVGARVTAIATGADEGVWVATEAGVVIHLVGSRRIQIDALLPNADARISALAVDRTGNVWCAWYSPPNTAWGARPGGWVARFDGRSWHVFDDLGLASDGSGVGSIVPMPDGSVWVTAGESLTHIEGDRWTTVADSDLQLGYVTAIAAGLDGSTWFASTDQTDGSLLVARLRNGTWTRYSAKDGLPAASGFSIAVGQGVFLATDSGIYRLFGSRWRSMWPVDEPSAAPGWSASIIGVTGNEAWLAGDSVWHYENGVWRGPEQVAASSFVRSIARTPDGTLWAVASDAGVSMRTSLGWRPVSSDTASAIWVDPDGEVWVASAPSEDSRTWRVTTYVAANGTVREDRHTASTDLIVWPITIARTPDSSLWVGSPGSWGAKAGLVRYLDGIWEQVRPPGTGPEIAIGSMVVASDGALWMTGTDIDSSGAPWGATWVARLLHGRWTVFGRELGLQSGYAPPLAAGPDGSVWLGGDRLARFDGTSWRTVIPAGFDAISVAPDGTVWASGSAGIISIPHFVTLPPRSS